MPDVYQGDELLDLSLVDPDNRRPVDWAARRAALDHLRGGGGRATTASASCSSSWRRWRCARGGRRRSTSAAAYEPVDAGPGVCAFVRGEAVLAVAPVRDWARLRLPASFHGAWRSVVDGSELELGGGRLVANSSAAEALRKARGAVLERSRRSGGGAVRGVGSCPTPWPRAS